MLYFDTSFLVPFFLEEPTSDKVDRFLQGREADELAVSHWTRVEFSAVLAREVRLGTLKPKTACEVDLEFEEAISESFIILLPSAADSDLSKEYFHRYKIGLRAGDALHLAIACNNKARAIYSLDRKFVAAGKKLGLPTRHGIRLP